MCNICSYLIKKSTFHRYQYRDIGTDTDTDIDIGAPLLQTNHPVESSTILVCHHVESSAIFLFSQWRSATHNLSCKEMACNNFKICIIAEKIKNTAVNIEKSTLNVFGLSL